MGVVVCARFGRWSVLLDGEHEAGPHRSFWPWALEIWGGDLGWFAVADGRAAVTPVDGGRGLGEEAWHCYHGWLRTRFAAVDIAEGLDRAQRVVGAVCHARR